MTASQAATCGALTIGLTTRAGLTFCVSQYPARSPPVIDSWFFQRHDFVRPNADVMLLPQMHSVATSTLAWVGFCTFILIMLAIDLGVFNRKPHEITTKNAAVWSAVWITLAIVFSGLL